MLSNFNMFVELVRVFMKTTFSILGYASLLSFTTLMTSPAFADVTKGLSALDAGDVALAASEFQAGFQAGNGDGAFYLGRLFEFGIGTDTDVTRAANLYAAGAEAGSILAMNRLGLMYLEGTTLLRDYGEASRLFCDAADLGDANGQLNCALMLDQGKGSDPDPIRAIEYFEAAAAQDNIAAQNLLAQKFMTGAGVDANPERAVELFTATADTGNAMGLFELAKHYSTGEVPDIVKAYTYANLAVVRRHPEALDLRDQLEVQMTNAQINKAQEQAKAWTAERITEQAVALQSQSE